MKKTESSLSPSYLKWNAISPDDFEKLCQMILGHFGFTNLTRLGGPGDRGRDIVCELTSRLGGGILTFTTKWVVQCKHYSQSPQIPLLQEDMSKAVQHGPDFWLLMTSASITPSVYDWLQGAQANGFKFRVLVLDGVEISRIILQQPTLAYMFKEKLFADDGLVTSELMALMGDGKYQEALDKIGKYSGTRTPRITYLEACCRSMIAKSSPIKNDANLEYAFSALHNSLDGGYISQLHVLFGWPKEKAIYEIERDPELKFLRERDLTRFAKILGIREDRGAGGGHGGCLVGDTPIRLQDGTEKPISSICIGEFIAVPSGKPAGAAVTRNFRFEEDHLISINNSITCSPSQPLLTTQGWKKALELERGDVLVKNRTYEPILSITYASSRRTHVFMVSLSTEHTFYAADYLVHNKMYAID